MGYPELALSALHHDSHEAYACDIPKPLKVLLEPSYGEITNRLDRAIALALGLPQLDLGSEEGRPIKEADDVMLVLEAHEYLAGDPPAPDLNREVLEIARTTIDVKRSMSSDRARQAFLESHVRFSQR